MSLKPPKGSGATPTPVKTNVVVKRHPSVSASPELTMFKDISWMTVGEERIEVTLRVNQIGDPYKPLKNGQPNKSKHLWIKCCTADDKAAKLKSFYATERVYETIRDNEIVHFTMLKATNVYNTQLHDSDLGYVLLIDDDSVVTGIRLQESAFIKENFADLNDGTTNRIRMGILTPFVGGKADESGKTECMARVYDNNENRAQLFIPFDNMADARSFKKGSNFVIKGYVRVKKDGVINISAKLEDIDRETVRKDDSVPDIANTCSTPKKAKIA
ncbi:hypothetical protein AAVH_33664 [Aphelenchoides avenae]|nr:hypothetical protein AAVH_33664 [Aphelenchus avenae]